MRSNSALQQITLLLVVCRHSMSESAWLEVIATLTVDSMIVGLSSGLVCYDCVHSVGATSVSSRTGGQVAEEWQTCHVTDGAGSCLLMEYGKLILTC